MACLCSASGGLAYCRRARFSDSMPGHSAPIITQDQHPMGYDTDKTELVLEQIKEAVGEGKHKVAMQLLRHADAAGSLKNDDEVVPAIEVAVGKRECATIMKAFAGDSCRYCKGGRETCEECDGKGNLGADEVCDQCVGLGLSRCPFCNGTAFAGYDFVPTALRPSVMALRLHAAKKQISGLAEADALVGLTAAQANKRILEIDRCRGILANAIERARQHSAGAMGARMLFSSAQLDAIERECKEWNRRAEEAIRVLLRGLVERAVAEHGDTGLPAAQRRLAASRAKFLVGLSRKAMFGNSVLSTPRVLR